MIAADATSLVAFLQGLKGPDVDQIDVAIQSGELVLPPIVITELLSDPGAGEQLKPMISKIATLPIHDGYWERAGQLRKILRDNGIRLRTEHALAAQACIDSGVLLITRNEILRQIEKHCGLKLA